MCSHNGRGRVAAVAMGWFLALGGTGLGAEPVQAVRLFAGRFTTETTGDSANPFSVDYEDRYILGAAYSRDTAALGPWLAFGWEAGAAARFPHRFSMEVWGGCYLRHRGIPLPGSIRLKPALVFGLSVVDRAVGTERERERRSPGRDARLLYYFGPELAVASAHLVSWELVARLHHRSGGMGTLGGMTEGHNAVTLGLRRRF